MSNGIRIKYSVIAAVVMVLAITVALVMSYASSDRLTCEVTPLDQYGFEQQSEFDEYVCANPDDKADFVVIADEHSEYSVGNTLTVKLNEHGEVLAVSTHEQR